MTRAALQLDFVAPPRLRWRWLSAAALAALALLLALLLVLQSRVSQRHEAAASRHELLSERLQGASPRSQAAPDALTRADIGRANGVIEELAVPWERLFDAVEDADARGLGALSLTPNARERTLRFAGEARDIHELLAYVDRMAAQSALGEVHLEGYNTVVRDGQPVLSFTLAANWRGLP